MTASEGRPRQVTLWEGDHEVIENLLDLGVTFWVFLLGDDESSKRSEHILQHFLTTNNPHVPVLKVEIKTLEEAARLGVVLLPQLRLYRYGHESIRHKGIASIDVLDKFYKRTLK